MKSRLLIFLIILGLSTATFALPQEQALIGGFNWPGDFASWQITVSLGSAATVEQVSFPRTEGTSAAKLEADFKEGQGWAEWSWQLPRPVTLANAKSLEIDFFPASVAGQLSLQLKRNQEILFSAPLVGLGEARWHIAQVDLGQFTRTLSKIDEIAIVNYKLDHAAGKTLIYLDYLRQIPFSAQEKGIGFSYDLSGEWLFSYDVDEVGLDKGWYQTEYQDFNWRQITVPGYWEVQGYTLEVDGRESTFPYNGTAWYRRRVFIPKAWEGKEVVLYLGHIDDEDITFFNGKRIGASTGWRKARIYSLDSSLLKFGEENLIAVRVYDRGVAGGIFAGPVKLEAKGVMETSPLQIRVW